MKTFCAALAFLALVGVTQAEPTYTWWKGEKEMNVKASSTGTWTIGMNLNVDALMSFGQGGSRAQSTYGDDYSQSGNALFSVNGDGYYSSEKREWSWSEWEYVITPTHESYSNRNMTVTMGWGGNWYTTLDDLTGLAGNAVPEGLQLGVTSTKVAENLSGGGLFSNGFNVYVADMKEQYGDSATGGVHDGSNGGYDWSISEGEKSACATLDDIATMTTIDKATLFVVHTYASGPADQLANDADRDYASDNGNYKTDITYTTFYLTVIGKDAKGNDVVYNFMGQQDDKSTYSTTGEGTMLGGSSWYDVDFVEKIEGINGEFVDSLVFVDSAMTSAQREQLMTNGLPEPGTATLSLMALAGLAARRRRR
ncbi:MAG: hypothetical protein IKV92_02915 [Akkermansia sp.]|nr:hypothetical protein [Akkermansia sp.]